MTRVPPCAPTGARSCTPARGAAAVFAGVLALTLAACTATDPAPPGASSTLEAAPSETVGSPAPSPTPSPTPTVEPPERPAAMDDDGVEGAKAAAEYFALLDTYIMKTNDTAVYEEMSHEMCETCSARLAQAREIAENGDTFSGGETSVSIVHSYLQDEATGIWPLDVEERVTAVEITNPEGDEVASFDEFVDTSRYEVVRGRDSWLIVAVVDPEG